MVMGFGVQGCRLALEYVSNYYFSEQLVESIVYREENNLRIKTIQTRQISR